MQEAVAIAIVGDEWIIARGVEKTLERAGYRITGLAASGSEALSLIDSDRPNLVIVDIGLPGSVDGIELAGQIRARARIPVVYLTAHSDQRTPAWAMDTEPAGYVVKPFSEGQLLSTIMRCLLLGGRARTATAVGAVGPDFGPEGAGGADVRNDPRLKRFQDVARALKERSTGNRFDRSALTARELDVVRLLLANGRVESIAKDLRVTPSTVRNHLQRVFRKLGVHSQLELINALPQDVTAVGEH